MDPVAVDPREVPIPEHPGWSVLLNADGSVDVIHRDLEPAPDTVLDDRITVSRATWDAIVRATRG